MKSSPLSICIRSLVAIAVFAGTSAVPLVAQGSAGGEVLTNASVTQMVVGKVPKDLILAKIHSTKSAFDLSPKGLIGLHTDKVSDDIIKAMMQAAPATAPKETLNDDAVIAMVKGLLSKEIILLEIQNAKADYDLTTDGIIKLNLNKVSQDVIKAMMASASGVPPKPAHL